jgi:hypothetical protein
MKSFDGIVNIKKKQENSKEFSRSSDKIPVVDPNKRKFLKLAGVAGIGALVYSFLPKQAHGIVFGSSMRTDAVRLKNTNGSEINPATEETLQAIAGINYDTTSINKSDPDNIIITYLLNGNAIATKTIVKSGTTVTIIKS